MRSLPVKSVSSQRSTWAQPAEGRPGPSDDDGGGGGGGGDIDVGGGVGDGGWQE